jgi:prevent-host-death family protein
MTSLIGLANAGTLSGMKTATIDRLKKDLDTVLNWVAHGEQVRISKRGRVLAVLTPAVSQTASPVPAGNGKRNGKRPDFLARLKRIYGDKMLPANVVLQAREQERY